MRTLAIVASVLVLSACGEVQMSAIRPATAVVAPAAGLALVRLRMEKPCDPVQVAAFNMVRRNLLETRYLVVGTDDDAFWDERAPEDIDMVIRSHSAMEERTMQTTLTIASRVGNRRLPPLSAKFAAVEGTIDEQSVAGLTPRWHAQRGMGDTGMTALGNGYAE